MVTSRANLLRNVMDIVSSLPVLSVQGRQVKYELTILISVVCMTLKGVI